MNARSIWTSLFTALLAVVLAVGCAKGPGTRADADIATDVQNKINADANLPNKSITVNANNGSVTLSGTVATETERLAAANDAAQVDGVKTVVNNLQVGGASTATNMPSGNTEPMNAAPAQARRATSTRPATTTSSAPARSNTVAPASATTKTSTPLSVAKVTVPSGTEMSVRVNDEISSEKVAIGDSFTATLDAPVYVGDAVVIPAHADVQGKVVDVKSAGKFAGRSELVLQLTSLSYNGQRYNLNTNHWQKAGASRGKNTAAKVGGGAAIGAVIGAIAGGGKGAAIGAGVGAGAGTGAQAITKSEQIVLRPESLLTFTLEAPLSVTPSATNQSTRRPMSDNQ
ncbi:MAG TPA: BON domain-containing protein [Terriglobales bacterium]|nr:BON domain-containing protein [Terriglobales bacterium]